MFELLVVLLTTVFVTLKLTHVVAWSWLVVLSPVILWLLVTVVLLAIIGGVFRLTVGRVLK